MRQILGRFVYNVIISQARPLTGRPRLSEGGRASQREAGPLIGRPGLSQGGRASYREAWPLTGRPGISQGDLVSQLANSQFTTCQKDQ